MAGAAPPRILHLLPAFEESDPAARRLVRLIEGLGRKAEHAIVSDDRERRGAARLLAKGARVAWPRFPAIKGSKMPGRLLKLAGAMQGYDLICSWGAGALDAALAHTLFADVHKLPPLVHHEFGADAAEPKRRGWYRRIALGRTAALVVPTRALETLALEGWDQPRTRVRLIPAGIDTRAFAAPAKRDLLPGLIKRREEQWLGTLAQALGAQATGLVRALAEMPPAWQLVIVGETAQRGALEAIAQELALEDRLHFATPPAARAGLLALFDALVLPEPDAVEPQLLLEAMAAGLPLVAPRLGEALAPLASDNGPLLFGPGDGETMAQALRTLTARPQDARRIGQANRAKAREEYDERRMVERHWALYAGLTGRSVRAPERAAD